MLVSYVAGMATNSVDGVRAHVKLGSFFSLSVFDSRESEMTPYFPPRFKSLSAGYLLCLCFYISPL
jgi:hypothetical protein